MEHNDIRHKLSEYIDGAVTDKEQSAIETHLKTCRQCSNALQELRKTIEHVKTVEEIDPPAWMTQKIMAKVRAEAEEKKTLFKRLFFPLAIKLPIQALAVLFLTITAYYVYQNINRANRYAETTRLATAKKEVSTFPSPGKEESASGIENGALDKTQSSTLRSQQVPQSPQYKALDMKQEYEKPAPPVPESKTAVPAPAPAKPAEQPVLAKQEAASGKMAAAPQAGAPAIMQEQAVISANQLKMANKEASKKKAPSKNNILKVVEDVAIEITCKDDSNVVGKCFYINGRLSLYNGNPSIRIWEVGSKRLYGVLGITESLYNQNLLDENQTTFENNLKWEYYIFGNYFVCPRTPSKPGVMQNICIESAQNLKAVKK